MNSATVIRLLILVIPAVWVVIRLMPAEHPQFGNIRSITSQERQSQQGTAGPTKEPSDKFAELESLVKTHYQSLFATSGYDFNHYRLAYKYGFELALDPDNQKMKWSSVEPQARQNWNERIMGPWSEHQEAILYGWEQGLKLHGG